MRRALAYALAAALAAGCEASGETTSPDASTPDASVPDASSNAGDAGTTPPLPWPATPMPQAPSPADNPTTQAKIDLGRFLFYDPILAADKKVACVECHSEFWGMSDGLARSVGIDGTGPAGPGRVGPNVTRRNALTLWNVAYQQSLFWDGRSPSLEDQVLSPLKEPAELGRDPAAVAADLAAIPAYVTLFQQAFPADAQAVTVLNLQRAIAAFERSMISDRAPYDHYVAGDEGALDDSSKRGMFLFASAGCATCHVPPLFASNTFADRQIPAIAGIADLGRFEFTHDPVDTGAYRVPTLRNVRETGPYFHTGAVDTLDEAVHHEAMLSPVALSEADISDIETFLDKALIDPTRAPVRPDAVPSGLEVPPDGFRIPR